MYTFYFLVKFGVVIIYILCKKSSSTPSTFLSKFSSEIFLSIIRVAFLYYT